MIGVEFASVFKSFGSEVTIVEALPRLVPNEDEFASKALERAFRRRKIAFKTGVRFTGAKQTEDSVTVSLESGEDIEADLLLVAVGRGPNTAGHGYEEAGVNMERGFVLADERLRTNLDNVYALGDIVPGLQLAHRGFAAGHLRRRGHRRAEPAGDRRDGHPARHLLRARGRLGRADRGPGQGQVRRGADADLRPRRQRQVADPADPGCDQARQAGREGHAGPVVGIHMVGARVGELIGEAQLVYNWDAEADDVAALIHAHPTQNEAFGEAHLALAGKPLHSHS